MELTKEYFDQQLNTISKRLDTFITKDDLDQKLHTFATKEDLKSFATKEDLRTFATKDDLKQQTKELKAYTDEQTENLARIIATTIANPMEARFNRLESALDVDERVTHLEHDMHNIKKALILD